MNPELCGISTPRHMCAVLTQQQLHTSNGNSHLVKKLIYRILCELYFELSRVHSWLLELSTRLKGQNARKQKKTIKKKRGNANFHLVLRIYFTFAIVLRTELINLSSNLSWGSIYNFLAIMGETCGFQQLIKLQKLPAIFVYYSQAHKSHCINKQNSLKSKR